MVKPYKECPPEITIEKIKGILNSIGITIYEQRNECQDLFYSSRIEIDSDNLSICNIGTNGKGMSSAFSLASAYAEFMERLQNGMLFNASIVYGVEKFFDRFPSCQSFQNILRSNGVSLFFHLAPEEREIAYSSEDAYRLIQHLFPNAINPQSNESTLNNNLTYHALLAPFYEVFSSKVQWIPYDWSIQFLGSNGMCAGNSKEEALVQGINEIIERYVVRTLYLKRITPPNYDSSFFQNTKVIQRLDKLSKEYDIDYYIKDCSLNEGYPVVGLLLIDRKHSKYVFHVGVDLSPTIALERCFTEIFQGFSEDIFQDIDFSEEIDIPTECARTIKNGRGRWYKELFFKENSYPASIPERNNSFTEKDDLKRLLEIVKKKFQNIYVRDVSFLGFNAFFVIIPGMSETNYSLCNSLRLLNIYAENYNSVMPQYNIKFNEPEIISYHTSRILELFQYDVKEDKQVTLFPYVYCQDKKVSLLLLLASNFLKLKNYKESLRYLKMYLKFQNNKKEDVDPVLFAMRDFLSFKILNYTDNQIISILEPFYGKAKLEKISDSLDNDAIIFSGKILPQCFNCTSCEVKKDCLFINILKFVKKIQTIQMANPIDQKCTEIIFDHLI